MASDYVREIDTVKDDDGCGVTIGVDHDTVSVSGYGRFNATQSAEFGRVFNLARMEAARNKRQMDEDAGDDAADALEEGDASFPLIPAAQIAAEAAADMQRLLSGG